MLTADTIQSRTAHSRTVRPENGSENSLNTAPTNLLHIIELFAGLPIDVVNRIGDGCQWQRVKAGKEIVSQREPSSDVFFVAEGKVGAKSFSAEGKEVTYVEIARGGMFGEFSAIDGKPRSATIRTLEESFVARMSSAQFRDLIASNPELGLKLAEHLVQKNRFLSDRIYEFSAMNVPARICAELLRMAADAGCQSGSVTLEGTPSHYELATRLNTHREAISREFSDLSSKGLIKTGRRKLTILDLEGLRRLTGG